VVAGMLLASAGYVAAHPHTWVEARATLHFDAAYRIDGIAVSLAIDEMTTSVLVEGLDADGNGRFDSGELQALAEDNAAALEEFGFFTEIRAADRPAPVAGLRSHNYRFEAGRLILTLDLALETAIDPTLQAVTIRLYDPTYYVMVELAADGPVAFADIAPEYCAASIAPPDQGAEIQLSEATFETDDPSLDTIGREFADVITIACPPHG
jgi:ABC-type uncharacterized transport system substrate-binding protein